MMKHSEVLQYGHTVVMVLLVLGSQITKSQATSSDCCSVNHVVFISAFVDRLNDVLRVRDRIIDHLSVKVPKVRQSNLNGSSNCFLYMSCSF